MGMGAPLAGGDTRSRRQDPATLQHINAWQLGIVSTALGRTLSCAAPTTNLLWLPLNAAFRSPMLDIPRAVTSGCFPTGSSLMGQPQQACKAAGPMGAGPRGAVGAGMGYEATAVLQLPRSLTGFRDRPQIRPRWLLAQGSCLQSITSPPGAGRGK